MLLDRLGEFGFVHLAAAVDVFVLGDVVELVLGQAFELVGREVRCIAVADELPCSLRRDGVFDELLRPLGPFVFLLPLGLFLFFLAEQVPRFLGQVALLAAVGQVGVGFAVDGLPVLVGPLLERLLVLGQLVVVLVPAALFLVLLDEQLGLACGPFAPLAALVGGLDFLLQLRAELGLGVLVFVIAGVFAHAIGGASGAPTLILSRLMRRCGFFPA
ncbi:MAG: hypothetical protein AAGD32_11710 [Planctomycetota bacterium]